MANSTQSVPEESELIGGDSNFRLELFINFATGNIDIHHKHQSDNSCLISVWHHRAGRASLPFMLLRSEWEQFVIDTEDIRERIAQGYSEKWDGHNMVGELDADAQEAWDSIRECGDTFTQISSYDAWDWFELADSNELAELKSRAIKDGIEAVAAEIEESAWSEHRVLVSDTAEYLQELTTEEDSE